MRARIRVVPVCGWRRHAKFAAEVRKTLLRKALHVPWVSKGLRRVVYQRCWRLLAPACVLLLLRDGFFVLGGVGGRFRLCKFSFCVPRQLRFWAVSEPLPHFSAVRV